MVCDSINCDTEKHAVLSEESWFIEYGQWLLWNLWKYHKLNLSEHLFSVSHRKR